MHADHVLINPNPFQMTETREQTNYIIMKKQTKEENKQQNGNDDTITQLNLNIQCVANLPYMCA